MQNYLSDQISVPRFSTDLPEFEEAEKGVQAEIDRLMNTKFHDQSVDSIHKKLYNILWNYVGMARTKEGLEKAIGMLKDIRKEFDEHVRIPGSKEGLNVELDKAIHLRDFITMGMLMAHDA
jgi:succinate dehydrogenase / fumarate reductase flavoprotein subunit